MVRTKKRRKKKKELKFLLGRELPLLRKQHGNSLWTWKGKPASSCRRPQSRANHAAEEALGVCDPGNGKRAKTSLLEKSPRRPVERVQWSPRRDAGEFQRPVENRGDENQC